MGEYLSPVKIKSNEKAHGYFESEGAAAYDKKSEVFWRYFPSRLIETYAKNVPEIKDHCTKKRSKPVIDLGSGSGHAALRLRNEGGLDVTCIDNSPEMIRMCKTRGLKAEVGDLLSIERSDESQGGVWAFKSLVHLPREQFPHGLLEIQRVLKRGGMAAICVILGRGQRETAADGIRRVNTYYEEDEITDIAEDLGFVSKLHLLSHWGNTTYIIDYFRNGEDRRVYPNSCVA